MALREFEVEEAEGVAKEREFWGLAEFIEHPYRVRGSGPPGIAELPPGPHSGV